MAASNWFVQITKELNGERRAAVLPSEVYDFLVSNSQSATTGIGGDVATSIRNPAYTNVTDVTDAALNLTGSEMRIRLFAATADASLEVTGNAVSGKMIMVKSMSTAGGTTKIACDGVTVNGSGADIMLTAQDSRILVYDGAGNWETY